MDAQAEQQTGQHTEQSEWVNGAEARRITSMSWGRLQRRAMLGMIAVRLIPGVAPRYKRDDLVALSRESSVSHAVGA